MAESLPQFAAVLRAQGGWWLLGSRCWRSEERRGPLATQGLPAGRKTTAFIVYDCGSPVTGLVAAETGCLQFDSFLRCRSSDGACPGITLSNS